MLKHSKALFCTTIVFAAAISAIGCTEEVSSPGAKPATGASEPAGGSGIVPAEKSGSGSR